LRSDEQGFIPINTFQSHPFPLVIIANREELEMTTRFNDIDRN